MKKTTAILNSQTVYASSTGKVRIGTKGASNPVSEVYGSLSKGEARKLRKALRAAGYIFLAAQKAA